MSRTASPFLAILLVVGFVPAVLAQSDAGALLIPGDNGAVAVGCAIAGSDLSLTVTFPSPVQKYLGPTQPAMSLTFFLDTDKNPRTGYGKSEDARKGGDYSIDFTVRLINDTVQASPDDVTVAQHSPESSFGRLVPVKASIRVDGNKIEVLVPLSALKLKKGKSVRIAAQNGAGVYVDQSIELK